MRILITGGTGSLGHALVKHWLATTTYRLVVLSRDELKQAQMREEFPDARLDFFLGDVRDLQRLELAFAAGIDVVVHAAALKRVDSVCYDPDEVFKSNVLGSRNVLQAARGRVSRCLLISSDKACYPTNAYGLSKAMAESLFTSFNVYGKPHGTSSAVVRYGNVLGSRGSVVTVWRKQIAEGKPLTLTSPEMTRFLITFAQAVELIEDALGSMEGGEIFVPRLKATTMPDLLRAVWSLGPLSATTIGLRPGGEKLHETLMTEEEIKRAVMAADDVAIIPPETFPWRQEIVVMGLSVPQNEWRSDLAPKYEMDELRKLVQHA